MDDTDFQRFATQFQQYQQSAKSAPSVWNQVAHNANAAAAATGSMAAAANATFSNVNNINSAVNVFTRHSLVQASAWERMAKGAHKFSVSIFEATRSLLRWGELTGLISGVLGVGGLYGIDRLAISASNQRKSALGLGVTAGEKSAFDIDYGRVLENTGGFLSGINEAMSDVTKRVSLYNAGLSEKDIQGKDTAQVGVSLIDKLKGIADKTDPNLLGNVLQTLKLDQFGINLQDLNRLRNTPREEIGQYRADWEKDQFKLALSPQVQKQWQDLAAQFERSETEVGNAFKEALGKLAPEIGKLSEAFAGLVKNVLESKTIREWIDKVADGMKWLAEKIDTPEFHDTINRFVVDVGDFVKGVVHFVEAVIDAGKRIENFFSGTDEKGEKTGPSFGERLQTFNGANGPLEDENERSPGSPAFRRKHGLGDSWWSGGSSPETAPEETPKGREPWDWSGWRKRRPGPDYMSPYLQNQSYEVPRGIRDNNPMNLTYSPGQGALGSEGRFGVYGSPVEGVAAAERQLLLYQDRDRLDTIAQIVAKWAPANENDTASYISQVSRDTGIRPNEHVDLHDNATAMAIIEAMIKRETGKYANPEVVARGVERGLAGQPNARIRPMVPNSGMPNSIAINVHNQTGGNAYISSSQLAIG